MQTFTPTVTGTITIDVYGAAGTGFGFTPGYGGRARGDYVATAGVPMYLFIGSTAGWNGGGSGKGGSLFSSHDIPCFASVLRLFFFCYVGAHGGGATDVRVGGTGMVNRIIVAGAGGGAGPFVITLFVAPPDIFSNF
jgi:hypothetical protein